MDKFGVLGGAIFGVANETFACVRHELVFGLSGAISLTSDHLERSFVSERGHDEDSRSLDRVARRSSCFRRVNFPTLADVSVRCHFALTNIHHFISSGTQLHESVIDSAE
jgi:hypothetical protein